MDILIGWRKFTTEFYDEEISMELLPLKIEGMLKILPLLTEVGAVKDGDFLKFAEHSLKIQAAVKGFLPEHVKNIDGITVNGESITPDQLIDESAFCRLVMAVVNELVMRSTITKDESKNSEEPSSTSSTEKPVTT